MRLIELGEAMRMVQNSKDDCPETSIKGRAIWTTAHNCALSCLTSCPTIDPSTLRPKGEWIPFENRWIGGIPWSGKECSHCRTTIGVRAEYNFCPNCGADMRQKEA